MKKHLLLFVFAVIALSAAPAMAGKKLNISIYNQHTGYKINWKRTVCDCIHHCDHLPGGTVRPHDMWPPGDEDRAQIESDGSVHNYCSQRPSDLELRLSTDPSYPESNTVIVSLRKYSPQTGDHWALINGCSNARDMTVWCQLIPKDNDELIIHLYPTTGDSKQPAKLPTAVDTNYYYRLTTMFRGDGESLEGNRADSPVHDGAAFMDKRQDVSGQLWTLVPEGEWFRLKTQFQGNDRCLEGNRADSPVHDGAAFMDNCQNVSGQLWTLVPEGEWFRLKTQFQGNDRCLEGNRADSPVHDGAAFMDTCQNVSGQLWKLEKTSVSSR